MTELHERWMGEPGPTDVLAFPMDELRPPQPGGNRASRAPDAGRRSGPARRRGAVPGGRGRAGGRGRPSAQDELELLARTGSCTCSATTTPRRKSTPPCSACRTSC